MTQYIKSITFCVISFHQDKFESNQEKLDAFFKKDALDIGDPIENSLIFGNALIEQMPEYLDLTGEETLEEMEQCLLNGIILKQYCYDGDEEDFCYGFKMAFIIDPEIIDNYEIQFLYADFFDSTELEVLPGGKA